MLDLPTQLEPLKSSFTWKGIRIKMMGSSIEGEFDIESTGPYFVVSKPKPRVNFFMIFSPNYTPQDGGSKNMLMLVSNYNEKIIHNLVFPNNSLMMDFMIKYFESMSSVERFISHMSPDSCLIDTQFFVLLANSKRPEKAHGMVQFLKKSAIFQIHMITRVPIECGSSFEIRNRTLVSPSYEITQLGGLDTLIQCFFIQDSYSNAHVMLKSPKEVMWWVFVLFAFGNGIGRSIAPQPSISKAKSIEVLPSVTSDSPKKPTRKKVEASASGIIVTDPIKPIEEINIVSKKSDTVPVFDTSNQIADSSIDLKNPGTLSNNDIIAQETVIDTGLKNQDIVSPPIIDDVNEEPKPIIAESPLIVDQTSDSNTINEFKVDSIEVVVPNIVSEQDLTQSENNKPNEQDIIIENPEKIDQGINDTNQPNEIETIGNEPIISQSNLVATLDFVPNTENSPEKVEEPIIGFVSDQLEKDQYSGSGELEEDFIDIQNGYPENPLPIEPIIVDNETTSNMNEFGEKINLTDNTSIENNTDNDMLSIDSRVNIQEERKEVELDINIDLELNFNPIIFTAPQSIDLEKLVQQKEIKPQSSVIESFSLDDLPDDNTEIIPKGLKLNHVEFVEEEEVKDQYIPDMELLDIFSPIDLNSYLEEDIVPKREPSIPKSSSRLHIVDEPKEEDTLAYLSMACEYLNHVSFEGQYDTFSMPSIDNLISSTIENLTKSSEVNIDEIIRIEDYPGLNLSYLSTTSTIAYPILNEISSNIQSIRMSGDKTHYNSPDTNTFLVLLSSIFINGFDSKLDFIAALKELAVSIPYISPSIEKAQIETSIRLQIGQFMCSLINQNNILPFIRHFHRFENWKNTYYSPDSYVHISSLLNDIYSTVEPFLLSHKLLLCFDSSAFQSLLLTQYNRFAQCSPNPYSAFIRTTSIDELASKLSAILDSFVKSNQKGFWNIMLLIAQEKPWAELSNSIALQKNNHDPLNSWLKENYHNLPKFFILISSFTNLLKNNMYNDSFLVDPIRLKMIIRALKNKTF